MSRMIVEKLDFVSGMVLNRTAVLRTVERSET